MHHSERFLALVLDAKSRIRETNVIEVKQRLDRGENLLLVDVREESEWEQGHLPGAHYLGKGVIERDIERMFPDPGAELILYCGGGFRSALAADNLTRMGYTKVVSMDGGIRGRRGGGSALELDQPSAPASTITARIGSWSEWEGTA
jgi:rhodanese-related sulfurtransferase